jgi:hypothetical protein
MLINKLPVGPESSLPTASTLNREVDWYQSLDWFFSLLPLFLSPSYLSHTLTSLSIKVPFATTPPPPAIPSKVSGEQQSTYIGRDEIG